MNEQTDKESNISDASQQEDTLWQRYFSDRSDENRNALIEFYFHKITIYVRSSNRKIGNPTYSDDEAISDVSLRLISAITRYDPSINDSFLAFFLSPRMLKGSILDGIERVSQLHEPLRKEHDVPKPDDQDSQTDFIDLCESRFEGLSDLDYEIAQAMVFEDVTDNALIRQLHVGRCRIKRVREFLASH